MIHSLWNTFAELICTPFRHGEMIWGIVPLYFGLLLNELTSEKASFQTALQTGFSFVWAAAQWLYPYVQFHGSTKPVLVWNAMSPVNLIVTVLVLLFGLIALFSGLVRRYPKFGSFLGRTRFTNYFMITIFPIQTPVEAFHLPWTWERLVAIAVFAVPAWVLLHYGLMPLRKAK